MSAIPIGAEKMLCEVNGETRFVAWLFANADIATEVWLDNLPGITHLPNLDAATEVRLENLPRLTHLPNLDAATVVVLNNLPGLTSLPNMDAATEVWLKNLPGITSLPRLGAAIKVGIYNLPGLTSLPRLDAATYVYLKNLPGLTSAYAGEDSRNYQFFVIHMRGEWRIIAGCRNFSFDEARKHWGPEGASDRPDCLALVEKLIASVQVVA